METRSLEIASAIEISQPPASGLPGYYLYKTTKMYEHTSKEGHQGGRWGERERERGREGGKEGRRAGGRKRLSCMTSNGMQQQHEWA